MSVLPAGHRSLQPTAARPLSGAECRSWLSEHTQGRLGHQTGRGPRSVVVSYAVTDDQIVVRIPAYNEISQYAPGRQVTLNVGCVSASSHTRTEVTVTGIGFIPGHQANLADAVDLPEDWPPGISTQIICLDLAVVEGETQLDSASWGPVLKGRADR